VSYSVGGGVKEESKRFFFEKKKQKTFANWATGADNNTDRSKSFLVLFSKKEPLPLDSLVVRNLTRPARRGCRHDVLGVGA
jgi:hypothetical protein